jgi:hypothetical protein
LCAGIADSKITLAIRTESPSRTSLLA